MSAEPNSLTSAKVFVTCCAILGLLNPTFASPAELHRCSALFGNETQVTRPNVTIEDLFYKDQPWIEEGNDLRSPPPIDQSRFEKSSADLANVTELENIWDGLSNRKKIKLPNSQVENYKTLADRVKSAPTFEHGIALLKDAMIRVGLIKEYDTLKLQHASYVPPATILTQGILSANEISTRGLELKMTGQRVGDGIYTVGIPTSGWGIDNRWGRYIYQIEYRNVWIMHNNNSHADAFLDLYLLLRRKWNKSLADGYDGIMAVGNGFESLSHMSWFYSDMGILGGSFALEVLLKTRVVEPQHVKFLKDLNEPKSKPIVFNGQRPDVEIPIRFAPNGDRAPAKHLIDLMSRNLLIDQSNASLVKRGLAKEVLDGICGHTSAINLLHALFRSAGLSTRVFQEKPDWLISESIRMANGLSGANNTDLEPVVKKIALMHGLKVFTKIDYSKFNAISVADILPGRDRLVEIAFISSSSKSDAEASHALIVLHVDKNEKVLYVSDPNSPNQIIKMRYWLAQSRFRSETIHVSLIGTLPQDLFLARNPVGYIDGFLAVGLSEIK